MSKTTTFPPRSIHVFGMEVVGLPTATAGPRQRAGARGPGALRQELGPSRSHGGGWIGERMGPDPPADGRTWNPCHMWVLLKIKQEVLRRFWSMFPLRFHFGTVFLSHSHVGSPFFLLIKNSLHHYWQSPGRTQGTNKVALDCNDVRPDGESEVSVGCPLSAVKHLEQPLKWSSKLWVSIVWEQGSRLNVEADVSLFSDPHPFRALVSQVRNFKKTTHLSTEPFFVDSKTRSRRC